MERLTLPAFQRRALVLTASCLVLGAIKENSLPGHRIEVEVVSLGFGALRLRTVIEPGTCKYPDYSESLEDFISVPDEGCLDAFAVIGRLEVGVSFGSIGARHILHSGSATNQITEIGAGGR